MEQRGIAITRCPFVFAGSTASARLPVIRTRVFLVSFVSFVIYRRWYMRIDLNADVGESFGAYTLGNDAALMASITSANIAAGFHAGDPSVLRATIRLAKTHGVAIGAHPGFPDLAGFGRRELHVTPGSGRLHPVPDRGRRGRCRRRGRRARARQSARRALQHGRQGSPARRRLGARRGRIRSIAAPLRSAGFRDGQRGAAVGLPIAVEVFADRAYEADGQLASRQKPGAVIHDVDTVVARASA